MEEEQRGADEEDFKEKKNPERKGRWKEYRTADWVSYRRSKD